MQILTGRRDTQLFAFLWQHSFSLWVRISLQKPQLHQGIWVVSGGCCGGPGQGSSILNKYLGFSSTTFSSVLFISSAESSSIFLWKEDKTLYVEVVIKDSGVHKKNLLFHIENLCNFCNFLMMKQSVT